MSPETTAFFRRNLHLASSVLRTVRLAIVSHLGIAWQSLPAKHQASAMQPSSALTAPRQSEWRRGADHCSNKMILRPASQPLAEDQIIRVRVVAAACGQEDLVSQT